MGNDLDWPLAGNQLMAWAPPEASLPLASVPVTAEQIQEGLTSTGYLEALAYRMEWMVRKKADPREAIDRLGT